LMTPASYRGREFYMGYGSDIRFSNKGREREDENGQYSKT
jgi:hypothetical protein